MRLLGFLILFFVFSAFQQKAKETFDLEVEVIGWKDNQGQMVVALFNEPEKFLKKDFKHVMVKNFDGKCIARFENIPDGIYAVSVFHDRNLNGKLDSNMFGYPKEPYGFSNNATGILGPPDFNKSSIKISGQQSIRIDLR